MRRACGEWGRTTLQIYRDWARYVARESHERSRFVVIDDLARMSTRQRDAGSQSAIIDKFQALADTYDETTAGPFPEYARAKVTQSLAYLRHTAGLPVNRDDIVARGTPWLAITDDTIDTLHRALQSEQTQACADHPDLDVESYLSTPVEHQYVGREIVAASARWLTILRDAFPWLTPFAFREETVESPGGWRNMVTHDGKEFVLLVNGAAHQRYTRALVDCFALHEVCGHMVHLAQLAAQDDLQRQAPHLLCIAIHTQDSLLTEGVAQMLAGLLVYRLSPSDVLPRLAFRQFELFFAVRHRNIMDLIEARIAVNAAVDRHITYLGGDPAAVAAQYRALLQDPFFCCQVLNYFTGLDALSPVWSLSAEQLDATLRRILTGLYSYDELWAMARVDEAGT